MLKSSLQVLTDLVFPNICVVCQQTITTAGSFCGNCRKKFIPANLGNWVGKVTVSDGLDRAYSGWFFDEGIQEAIHNIKYSDRARLGTELGRYLDQVITPEISGDVDLLTSIPLHPVKLRERGYNQARFIAQGLAESWNVSVQENFLKRIKYTVSQTALSRSERVKNVGDAFEVKRNVKDLRIGLVDDVLTTGSTMSACALALKSKGAREIIAITCSTPNPNS